MVAIGSAIGVISKIGTAVSAANIARKGLNKLVSSRGSRTKTTSKKGAIGKAVKVAGVVAGGAAALYGAEKLAEKLGVRGGAGFIGKRPDGSSRKRRRINPLNLKALRRSTSRMAGFDKVADKVRKELSKLAPRPKSRSSAGTITASEAIKALRN